MGKVADAWSKVAEEASKVWDGWGNLKPTLEALVDLANLYADRETEAAEIMSAQRSALAERDKRIAELEADRGRLLHLVEQLKSKSRDLEVGLEQWQELASNGTIAIAASGSYPK